MTKEELADQVRDIISSNRDVTFTVDILLDTFKPKPQFVQDAEAFTGASALSPRGQFRQWLEENGWEEGIQFPLSSDVTIRVKR